MKRDYVLIFIFCIFSLIAVSSVSVQAGFFDRLFTGRTTHEGDLDLTNIPEKFSDDLAIVVGSESEVGANSLAAIDMAFYIQFNTGQSGAVTYLLDNEINNPSNFNLILIGNSCDNPLIPRIEGTSCSDWELPSGRALVKIVSNGDKLALIVGGITSLDTRRAARAIRNRDVILGGDKIILDTSGDSVKVSNEVKEGTEEYNVYELNIEDSVIVNGKKITLKNVGGGGAIIVEVDGFPESIATQSTEVVNSISIKNVRASYSDILSERSASIGVKGVGSIVAGIEGVPSVGQIVPSDSDLSLFPKNFVRDLAIVVGSEGDIAANSLAAIDMAFYIQFNSGSEVTPISLLSSEVNDPKLYNLVLIGNPCENNIITRVAGISCNEWNIPSGKALVRVVRNGDKLALIVGGSNTIDTRRAARMIRSEQVSLQGSEVILDVGEAGEEIIENPSGPSVMNECELGESRCEDDIYSICLSSSVGNRWGTIDCGNFGQVCSEAGCIAVEEEEILECGDSDNGRVYNIRGTVSQRELAFTDLCENDEQLREYYCSENEIMNEVIDCGGVCVNGVCLEKQGFLIWIRDTLGKLFG